MSGPLQRVVLVGRDAPLWLAALALHRALGQQGLHVLALELPSILEDSDVYATVPGMAALHEMLGFDEAILAAQCIGVPLVAQRFSNWSRTRSSFLHGYDSDESEGEIEFAQLWLKARRSGLQVAYEDFSLGAAAAKQGRVPLQRTSGHGLAAGAGYQVDSVRYSGLLKHQALRAGVEHRTGRLADVEVEGERIVSVSWEGGERFEGDLFIDASGPEAILIGRLADHDWVSWSQWLPCNRTLVASGPPLEPLPAFSQVSAFRSGWLAIHPLQERTAVTACFSAEHTAEEVLENFSVLAGVPIEGDAAIGPLESGIRSRPWIGNCVAIGAAAVLLEPLYPAELHLAHIGIAQLIALFPNGRQLMPEAEPYGAAFGFQAANIRDLQIAHYRLNRRFDEPFWDGAREAEGPAGVDERIAIFSASGHVPILPQEPVQAEDWATVFIGHGRVPQAYDPRIDEIPEQEQIARVRQRLRDIAALVETMPTVDEFIAAAKRPLAGRS